MFLILARAKIKLINLDVKYLPNNKIRLQKYLSECGVASRRKSEEFISKGLVKVNGNVAKIGDSVDPYSDLVTLNGKKVEHTAELKYIMLHKPRGFVTTMSDELGRRCVASLVEDVGERVYPIGRLDRNSEGLLLLTNDGAFANAVMHPSKHVPKVYRVTVRPGVTDDQISTLMSGMVIDGRKTAPTEVKVLQKQEGRTVLEIVLYEGRNRQIRKMCEQLEIDVARLKRVSIAGVKLGMLQQGKWRDLTEQEVSRILSATGATQKGASKDNRRNSRPSSRSNKVGKQK